MISHHTIDAREYRCGPWVQYDPAMAMPADAKEIVEVEYEMGCKMRLPASEHVWGERGHGWQIARFRLAELAE